MEQIVEDEQEFDWDLGVRRWSEEIFSRVAQNRLPFGWHSRNDIQMLRLTMSRAAPLKLSNQMPSGHTNANQQFIREPAVRRPQQSAYHNQQEILKGGPPCPTFNSGKGCQLPSGHISNGKRMVHVCSFCLLNTSAANAHPEAQCRNKVRLANSTSHFQ